jgi:predicted phage terminase large subunit-like protein
MLTASQSKRIEAKLALHQEALKKLPPEAAAAFRARMSWLMRAHKHQIPPKGNWWTVWLLLAGRGAGKTRTAAEDVWHTAWTTPNIRILISGPTSADIRDTMIEGESGLLNCMPEEIRVKYTRSLHEIVLTNGSLIKGIPASEPERFRGPQWHHAWCDELAAWEYLDAAWDQIMFSVRLGDKPRIVVTTTPKPKPLIIDLLNRDGEDVVVTQASTYDNLANLAGTFKQQILQYEGTSLGRQEIHAEIIDPEEAGIIKRAWIKLWPSEKPFPRFEFVVQSYDGAYTEKTINDPSACSVWGIFKPSEDKGFCAMLIDCWEEHLQYPDLKEKVIEDFGTVYGDPNEFGQGKKTDMVLVEDKSSGISLLQDLGRAHIPCRSYNPGGADKVQRVNLIAPLIKAGRVYIPESTKNEGHPRSWAEPLVNQLCAFPEVRHDDLVDTTSQALRVLRDMGWLVIDPPPPDNDDQYPEDRPRRVNPYAV